MSKKKIAVILASTVLIASLAIGGTLAYLTDSGSVTNTFTVGNVKIALAEPAWKPAENPGLGVLPGDVIPKDPTVTATAGNSYMRVKVEIVTDDGADMTAARAGLIMDTIEGWDFAPTTGFTFVPSPLGANPNTYYYNYNSIFNPASAPATLFTTISIPTDYDSVTIDQMGKYQIIVTAQAIQSDNFDGDFATASGLAYAELDA